MLDTPVFLGELMISKPHKYEARYKCNINYYATYEKGLHHPKVRSIYPTQKGHINIRFKGLEEVSTLISAHGTIQVFYFTLDELTACLNNLKEILVPKLDERLYLAPQGTYILVDRIRYLIQEGKITHDMSLDSGKLEELTGWEKEDIRRALPTILQEIFPFGIELKVSRIIAGCSTAEPYVEEWLNRVEQALKREGFYSPYSFEWEQNQSFELVRHMSANCGAMVHVKAFLDGRVITEAKPKHLTESADRILNNIFDKYDIPYETEIPVKIAKNPFLPVAILGIAILGTLALCELSNGS